MSSLKSTLKMLWRTDARLTALGLSMIVLTAATTVALFVDPRQILGAPAWMKPLKFSVSFAIYTLTLTWVFSYLPEWVRIRRAVSWITAITLVLEVVIIDLQAWRGTTSHFNAATPLDSVLFSIMGLAIVVQTLSSIAVAVALWRQGFADRALGWALRLGMTITIAGAATGGLMTRPTAAQLDDARATHRLPVVGAHTVGAPDGGPGLPGVGWSRDHGDLRVAHFIGLHALQILPIVTLFVRRKGSEGTRQVRMVWAVAASYAGLYVLLLSQALCGQSVIQPDSQALIGLGVWAILSAGALWVLSTKSTPIRTQAIVY